MTRKKILVINPNSNESVTDGLRRALTGFADRAEIECCTLADGPFGIESDADVAVAGSLVIERVEAAPDFDACVIACYSDPGLAECRRRFDTPVYGMQQSAIETAVSLGGRFGVLALADESITRHLAYIRQLGHMDALAAELPLDITVDGAANDPETIARVIRQGSRLVREYGAASIILGCAGMAHTRAAAQKKLPVPVIEPTQAAVELAISSS